jgi:hypothetical protein
MSRHQLNQVSTNVITLAILSSISCELVGLVRQYFSRVLVTSLWPASCCFSHRSNFLATLSRSPYVGSASERKSSIQWPLRHPCDFYTAPDATRVLAGVSAPPDGSIVTASADGAGELANVNVTWLGERPITPIDTGLPPTMPQS